MAILFAIVLALFWGAAMLSGIEMTPLVHLLLVGALVVLVARLLVPRLRRRSARPASGTAVP